MGLREDWLDQKESILKARLLERVKQLIKQGEEVRAALQARGMVDDTRTLVGFRTAGLFFIKRAYGATDIYYEEFDKATAISTPEGASMGIAILESIKEEIEGEWLCTIKGLITAEVFSDFLEMANDLLQQDNKDAAAVIAGSVLEAHLRQLCVYHGIEVEVQSGGPLAERLNADLARADAYSKLDHKAVTMWLDLKNKAAHGTYDEYAKDQVINMIAGITEFMARMPV